MGSRLRTEFGYDLRVLGKLGEGGQGAVYVVAYGNERKALKWYFLDRLPNKQKFVANLRHNVLAGAPTSDFLWPLDLVMTDEGGLGYVMELRPDGYLEANELLETPSLVPSFKRMVDVCLNIVTAFRILHGRGYCYQDINGGNFFVDPHTGKVLICDNDNVAPGGTDTGMLGHPKFMAPEIVLRQSSPNIGTDMHSMAVLIFYLLMLQHPLEGIRALKRDADSVMRMYGSDPIFIFDPTDGSNAPIQSIRNNALRIWPYLPGHMKDIFVRAFSHEALHDPSRRPSEVDWLRELVRFRSEIATCRCGNEVFLDGTKPCRCERCGSMVDAPLRLEVVNSAGNATPLVPVMQDARVYACQVSRCDADSALNPLVWMLASKRSPRNVGLRNVSQSAWEVQLGDETRSAAPNTTIRAFEGISLKIEGMRSGEYLRVARNTDMEN